MGEYTYYSDPLRKLTLYQGVTTADGAGDGSTLVCSDLTSQDEDYDGNHVIITSGTYRNARDINGTTLTGTVTFTSALEGQIVKGTTFMILGFRTTPAEVAAIATDVTAIKDHLEPMKTRFGGFEDELLLKDAADPAALDTDTRLTVTLPTGATVSEAFLMFKFRELYCAAANYVGTLGYVQVQKVAGGSWVSGITIKAGALDVAAGASGAGDILIGNVDVSAQVASGEQVEFQLVTLRSNADDLAIRDIQCGIQVYYTL